MYNPQSPSTPGVTSGTLAGDNTSGMGRAAILPPELRGWNWGAFFLNLFWGIGNGTWIALLMLLPIVSWVMPFVLGAKGNAWAWQNKRWRDVAHFRRIQRRWTIVGLVLWLGMIGLVATIPMAAFNTVTNNPVRELAFTAVRTSPEATAILGTPIHEETTGPTSYSGGEGSSSLAVRFTVSGPHGSALVSAAGRKSETGWELDRVVVTPSGGGVPLVVFPRQRL